jgi:hypothetical protein
MISIVMEFDGMNGLATELPVTFARFQAEYAERIKTATRGVVPVRTGFLRDSIGIDTSDPLSPVIYADAPYAQMVHDGTSRMPARPFFEWALSIVVPNYVEDVQQLVEDIARRNGAR